ncbi:Zinc finger BED domain-containing protein 1 [Merluccius polli]|uniref:Zinc finger BED domain-containing protein 1 n=1 Tax=Merluccius polli TaxID=89951 RepID=A0AA47MBM3_MERPO|nr:Zinc finger BED domain-containing protein 1 [Merluccius polli]
MLAHLRRHHPSVTIDGTRKRESGKKLQLLPPQPLNRGEGEKSDRAKAINKAMGVFIAKDMQPYAVVEDAGFQHMIKVLESRYNIPSRHHFSNTIIPELYEGTRQRIVKELSNTAYVALTTDGWTSRATETVTAHYINSEWEMKSSVLQTRPLYESHTSEHLSEALTQAVTEWKLERANSTIPVATNNASRECSQCNSWTGTTDRVLCTYC